MRGHVGAASMAGMGLLKTLEMLKAGERANDLLYSRTTNASGRIGQRTSGTRGSAGMPGQLWRTWSSTGSYEQAIVRMSPANALR